MNFPLKTLCSSKFFHFGDQDTLVTDYCDSMGPTCCVNARTAYMIASHSMEFNLDASISSYDSSEGSVTSIAAPVQEEAIYFDSIGYRYPVPTYTNERAAL